ncbi:FAS associated death domain protein [Apostichopus japonicus]|uniref:FAS associated death domain protein n=1 Tax=Stichopus japonicus TaxID=307972 RepID=A0A2G8JQM2_STIJA|nr:FAS associated death domain protein [Apostichopus japonicus]
MLDLDIKGQRPHWEERPLSPYIFHRSKCAVRLLGFCWLKIVIDDKEVEAKNIVVYAAKKILQDMETAKVSIGYYEDLPDRVPKILKLNPDLKLEQSLLLTFFKEGNQPLTISFNGTNPRNVWCTEQGNAKQEIPFRYIELSEERLVPFVLERRQSRDSFCNFTAQQGNSDPIKFAIEMEGSLPRGEILDSKVPDSILKNLAPELAGQWKMLARWLNISEADLHNIEAHNSRSMQDTKYCMLRHWSERNGTGATYRVLATALDKAGRRDLREQLESQVTLQGRNGPTHDYIAALQELTSQMSWV